jgi:alpha-beta hydrolase superfamily lysophospholipase
MKPFFFGDPRRQLFGAYYPASGERPPRDTAVVLAYPGVQEYNMSHWAFRRLASMLSREGFPTLRFDYYGTGDSMGETGQGSIEGWAADIGVAVREVLDLSGARAVSTVGMRLGGILSLKAATRCTMEDIVLWDPVVSGAAYVEELIDLDYRQRLLRLYPQVSRKAPRTELLGYPFTSAHRDELERLDARLLHPEPHGRLVVVATEDRGEYRQLVSETKSRGGRAQWVGVTESTGRARATEGEAALLSSKSLAAIVDALAASEAS